MMRTYYVDASARGSDGLSPETAVSSYRLLDIRPGDTILFRRGGVFRDALILPDGEEGQPVRAGAYGEGAKPAFLGSVDVSLPECWVRAGENLWKCVVPPDSEVGNLIFNHGESCGILAWEKEDLKNQGQWHDTRIGDREAGRKAESYELLLCSEENPGLYYRHIEAAVYGARRMCSVRAHAVIEDIAFRNSGVHGFASTGANNVTLRRCDFEFIGGMVWNRSLRIRFGNAFELWDGCQDVTMEDCRCYEIYDSCFTHQGPGEDCRGASHLRVTGNHFERYGMAAYEARDKVPVDMVFADNVCLDAGLGFAMQDETPPRQSEIWPQPMGHHLFLWRMPSATLGGRVEVRNNRFGAAPYGAHVYSIISPEAEEQFVFEGNEYDNRVLLAERWGGQDRQSNLLS